MEVIFMAHIFWELHEIPRPSDSYINHSDGRVFLMSDNGFGNKKRKVIGHATSETMMHPNELYKYLYPTLWKEYYGERELPEHELHTGLYALVLGIGYKTKLYPILHEVYGPLYGNAIMDYAMYSILDRTDTSQLFPERMVQQVLFSKEAYSDSWFSDFFRNQMTENANYQFKIRWAQECAQRGVSKVWLSIDGTNNDCMVMKSNLCEQGNAKSHTNSNIISYIWAVNAEDGCPITYFVNNGGMTDCKAFQKMAKFLKNVGIEIEGIIVDRGFCTHDVLETIEECGFPYIVMLKSDTYSHTQMMAQFADTIRWKVPYVVNDKGIFGISDKKQIFAQHPEKAYIHLFFDGVNGTARSVTLINKIRIAARGLQKRINAGERPTVPREMIPFLSVVENEDSWKIEYNYEAWQKAMDCKGFCSIASSADLNSEKVNQLYHLRDASEKQYMIMKSQLGFDTTRVHSTKSIENKFAVCFIASIFRSQIMTACKKLTYDTNQMIREIDRVALVLLTDGLYGAINNQTNRQKELLGEFNIQAEHFKFFADDVNRRMLNPINSQIHQMPESMKEASQKRRGRPPKKDKKIPRNDNSKRMPGRPKGSRNKKTLERENTDTESISVAKRNPGRPKGSKNKPKKSQ